MEKRSATNDLLCLGFDVSSTGTACCLLDHEGEIVRRAVWQCEGDESVRLRSLGLWADDVATWLHDYDSMVALSMEAPFFRGLSSRVLARAQGAVMSRFTGDWVTYAPAAVKATAREVTGIVTSEKNAGKDPMIEAGRLRWPLVESPDGLRNVTDGVKADGDLADAAWVAETDRLAILRAEGARV